MSTVLETSVGVDCESRLRPAVPVLSFDRARVLAEQFGTPLLVVSRSAVRRNFEAMRNALPGVEFFYAAKANPAEPILSTLCAAGCSVDVCSYGEMHAAINAGFTPDRMIHTHPCKTIANLTRCHQDGLRWFTYDNANEIPKFVEHTPDVNLLLRTAVMGSSSVINLSAKFGASEAEAVPLMLKAHRAGLRVRGLSFHVGSQCRRTDDYRIAFQQSRRIFDRAADAGLELEVLDFGGGIPAPYRESVLSLDAFCNALQAALTESFGDLPHVRVIGEPGRGMCADTVTLVTKVIGKSVRSGMPWYFIDDGIYGSFSGQVFDHTQFPLIVEGAEERELTDCVVAGPTCDSSDVVSRDLRLPDLEVGELILVPTMGAYTSASASNFNGLDMARIIGIE